MLTLLVNNSSHDVDVPDDTPLLWVLREKLGLAGTKFGCGIGQCGACTVHLDGEPVRSCSPRVSAAVGQKITTIEGLAGTGHPLFDAWVKERVSQCGYCQPGQIMSAAALLQKKPSPTEQDITDAMSGNLCRCGTYTRIRKAIHTAAGGGK